ncbi:adenylate/guanylate cyclase domain-containing protein [Stackebrandtia nassauensis]|uniref:Adenylate/guanylate cyclase with TPR repeats n=1 Tax=Stackebrandtia nassauensis (strain DSM 44728 / CIP 108903 / NRRL B-16338 / NBRC 102104 / LLR-40K-21) TaxID=446470 RepID=D3QA62_STANL|nr:adenylate/guanylate cyclase domain-containing protein [Stackebrandtia nassauensis]ADD40774.1 adenylate/guanylate cyclase with TPR repeats [Stackebrandtia nassauensis DSM 44728]
MSCPFCGIAAVVPGARYCHNCGGPLSPVASLPVTERRVVTVLFCDLSDFTAWSEGQDPERVGAVTDRVLAECAQAVTEYGGHVDKLTGDGLMAVFGAPVAHDDDAERAVRAAQRMRRAVRKLLKTESGGGVPMGLRVGLRTGLVVAGVQASVEYTVVGDTVNTAARLADVAEVGTVYASVETVRATKHVAAWRHLNPVRLKGKRDPVEVYELLGLHDEPGIRAGLGDRAPFVGRAPEMGRVAGRLDAAINRGEPISLVMTGEPGIGKTRMALESARLATSRGARVLSVRAAAYGQGYRLGPLADLIRKAIGLSIGDDRATAERQLRKIVERHNASDHHDSCVLNVDLLLAVLGYGPAPRTQGRPGAEETAPGSDAISAAAADLFNLLARETPLVLILDDLHAATVQALDFLGATVAALSGPILVIMFGRPSLVRTAGVLTRVSEAEAYTLTPLRGSDAARLLSAFCDNGKVDPEDESRLLATAQGNPYYLSELVTLLTEHGMLTEHNGVWELAPGSLTGRLLSADLAKVLTARIDALPPESRQLLREASVIGDVIPAAALEVLDSETTGDLDKALEALLSRRMLRRRTHGGYRFVTPLMREAAYAGLGKADLAGRHARLARWASETTALDGGQADQFAITHARRSVALSQAMTLSASPDVVDIGVAACGRAAGRAMDAAEPENALSLLEQSADLKPLSPADQLVRARALLRLGRTDDTLDALTDVATQVGLAVPLDAIPCDDPVAALTGPLADVGAATADTTAAERSLAAAEAQAVGQPSAEAADRPLAEAARSGSLGTERSLADAVGQPSAEARAAAQLSVAEGGDPTGQSDTAVKFPVEAARTLLVAGRAYRAEGEPDKAARVWSRAFTVARSAGLSTEQCDALCRLGMFDYLGGRMRRAEERFTTALRVATEGGDRRAQAWALQHLAWVLTSVGDFTAADDALGRALRLFALQKDRLGRAWVRSSAAFTRLLAGRLREAQRLAEAFRPFGEKVGDAWAVGLLRGISAYAAADLGELAEADTLARKAFREFDRIADDWGRGFTLVVRGAIARDLGELEHAMELVDEAELYATKAAHPLLTGMARVLRGYCLLGLGDFAAAEACARESLSLARPHDVLEPVKVGPLALLAESRAAQGDTDGALRWLAEIAAHADDPALLYSRRRAVARYAQLLWRAGRAEEARHWALRAQDAPGEDANSERLVRQVIDETGASQGSSETTLAVST